MSKKSFEWSFLAWILIGWMANSGCKQEVHQGSQVATKGANTFEKNPTSPATAKEEHSHAAGEHGGTLVALGRDQYHVEAVIESDGKVRLYTLGQDETRVIDIEAQTLKAFVKIQGESKYDSIDFEAAPQPGDAPQKTSLFISKLPPEYMGKNIDVTIPNFTIEGQRFRLAFKSATVNHETHDPAIHMPNNLADDEERALYLVPAGRYTAADIAANGNTTAAEKFKGIKSAHDMFPKEGDRICPITKTKANQKFTWIVDGKPYEFCCPPCVDEFLKSAKASIEPIADPTTFVKK
ncbi:MAG: hypothetical protein ABL921_27505 [Pirellula sp.]